MVARGISVVVVDGDFLELVKLGFPLPAAVSLQQACFNLRSACWDVRKSLTGFSLSFFWPASQTPGSRAVSETQKAHCPVDAMKKRRRRRRRRQGRARAHAQPSAHDSNSHASKSDNSSDDVELRSRDAVESQTLFCDDRVVESDALSCDHQVVESVTSIVVEPINDDDPVKTAVVSNLDSVDIPSDADVYYYQHEDTPGLCVENSDGDLSWSPVKFSHSGVVSQDSPGCTETIDVADIDVVEYQSCGGVPGVEVTTPDDCVWLPVACRTRSRLKS